MGWVRQVLSSVFAKQSGRGPVRTPLVKRLRAAEWSPPRQNLQTQPFTSAWHIILAFDIPDGGPQKRLYCIKRNARRAENRFLVMTKSADSGYPSQ